jgi:hypothetical protein
MALLDAEGLVGFLLLMFWAWAVIDVIATDSSLCRNLDKGVWLILVIILPDLGALAWILLGRPEGAGFMPGGATSSAPRARQPRYRGNGPYGPDSAPRYLGEMPISDRRSEQLDAELDAAMQQMSAGSPASTAASPALDQWENELARREEALRRRELERREAELARREAELDDGN